MNNKVNFRLINQIEKDIIVSTLLKVSPRFSSLIEDLKNNLYISIGSLTSKNKVPEIYLVSNYQHNLLNSLIDEVISAGLYLGFIKKGNFFLSLEGVEFLYNNNIFSDFKKIYVNEKGEKSILYGNNISKNMIIKTASNLKKNDFLVIFNEVNEIIALGNSILDVKNIQNLKPDIIIAINLIDKGFYLRKKQ